MKNLKSALDLLLRRDRVSRELQRPRDKVNRESAGRYNVRDTKTLAPDDYRASEAPRERNGQNAPYRDMQLGVDFGTAWSKLVLRDLSRPGGERYCIVIRPQCSEDYRFPSIVTFHEGRLWFGAEAVERRNQAGARCFASLKMRAAFPDQYFGPNNELPKPFDSKGLAILQVLYLLQEGFAAASTYCAEKGSVPRLGFTLGVPVAYLDHKGPRDIFHEIAVIAFRLLQEKAPSLRDSLSLQQADELLQSQRHEIRDQESWGLPEDWLRPEVTSALMWAFNSPEIGPGLYAAIDIGAGTTSASFFNIVEEKDPFDNTWRKSKIAFFGAASEPPGIDKLDQELAKVDTERNQLAIRGRESAIIEALPRDAELPVQIILNEYYRVYRQAWQDAYRKDRRQGQWENYGLLLLGGGSKVDTVRKRFEEHLVPNWKFTINFIEAGQPGDLHELNGSISQNVDNLLLVAYGLSFPHLEIPAIATPSEVPPLELEMKLKNVCVYYDPYD